MKFIKTNVSQLLHNNEKLEKSIGILMAVLLIVSMILLAKEAANVSTSQNNVALTEEKLSVMIDAGHGAEDPGKIGINKILEKDVNLIIALRVKSLLEAQDVRVYMTRVDDKGFYPSTGSNKKIQDMKKRVEYINKTDADLTVSIHQNSYEGESIHGAQAFYYGTSVEGKKAAEIMQKQLIQTLDKENKREAKNNTSYYLLKKTKTPIIIVECGFLSNRKEAELLATSEYQEKVAWAIHLGILKFLNSEKIT